MENKIEVVKSFCLGQKKLVNVLIYGKNIDSEKPSFSFDIKFSDGSVLSWDKCSENYGGFEYVSQEDAVDAALDFLVDHANFQQINEKDLRKASYDADLNGELDCFNDNPEDNIEEVPEDFRLDMKN